MRPPMSSTEGFGVCRAGNTSDECYEDAQCKSGACIDGSCSSRENRVPCLKPEHCLSGFCAILPPAAPTDLAMGICDSGETGALCGLNGDCKSAHCALRSSPDQYGICTDGRTGDPCVLAADCSTQVCTVTRPHDALSACVSGAACGQGGVCDGVGECQYGRCN